MKKVIALVLIAVIIAISGCTASQTDPPEIIQDPSEGLVFEYYEDGLAKLVSFGTCTDSVVVIPEKPDGYHTVTYAYINEGEVNEYVRTLVIPKSTSFMNIRAPNLEKLVFADGSEWFDIFYMKISNFENLKEIVFPESLVHFNGECEGKFDFFQKYGTEVDGCLYYDKYLVSGKNFTGKTLKIKKGTKVIPNNVFQGCESLQSLKLPDGLTYIGATAFNNTPYYNNEANWDEDGVLYCGNYLISAEHLNKSNYIIKPGTVAVASGAFDYCRELECINIPDSVKYFCDNTFASSENLRAVNFQSTETLFRLTTVLSNILYMPYDLYINGEFLEELVLPEGTETIRDNYFSYCTSIKSVILPEGLKEIGGQAFRYCKNLETVNIPDSLEKIGFCAFSGCNHLLKPEIPDGVELGINAFD